MGERDWGGGLPRGEQGSSNAHRYRLLTSLRSIARAEHIGSTLIDIGVVAPEVGLDRNEDCCWTLQSS